MADDKGLQLVGRALPLQALMSQKSEHVDAVLARDPRAAKARCIAQLKQYMEPNPEETVCLCLWAQMQ
eukprot:3090214-Amphidinium_carterae.1